MNATNEALARRAGLSPRHFARLFSARRMPEAGERPKQAAATCGFPDIDTCRRALQRNVGVTSAEYRLHYEMAGAA